MVSAEVLFIMTCTGPAVAAPADSVTAFTHIDSRASPRQESGDPLTSLGCLNISPLEQAGQEEIKGFKRMGTAQLPAFPTGDCDKSLAIGVAVDADRTLDQEHLSHLFGLSSSLQDLICLQVVQLLASLLLWVPNRELQGVLFLLFIYPLSILRRANLYLSSSVYEGPHKAAQPPEKLICALHLLSLITEGKQWRYSHGSARAPLPIRELIKYVSCI